MTPLTITAETCAYADQAHELRQLVAQRAMASTIAAPVPRSTCRSIALFSGKGGVGKSVIALNLAITLARQGASTGLLDASPGAGNLSLLCGQNGYWNLEHVAAGARTLDEITLKAPCGARIIPGGHHLLQGRESAHVAFNAIAAFERQSDWLIVDVGLETEAGRLFAAAADRTLIVTTPEPTSIAGAYAAIKTLAAAGINAVSVLVNQAETAQQAEQVLMRLRQATRAFLGSDIGLAGWVPHDTAVSESVFRRVPFAGQTTGTPAQLAMDQLEQRLTRITPVSDRCFAETLQRQLERVQRGVVRSAA